MDSTEKFYLEVVNWDEFQHYKSRTPPWIKLHRKILDNYNFCRLQDASKLHLMMIWLYASQHDNMIPPDPVFLAKILHLDATPDLEIFLQFSFLSETSTPFASDLLATRKQNAPSVEKRREEKNNGHLVRFDDFWSSWPKKVAKAEAQKAWKAGKCDKMADIIIADVKAKAGNGAWENKQYIPYPARYLRGKRWEDEKENKSQPVLKPGSGGIF